MDRAERTVMELLIEAHSNELALVNVLEAHVRIAEGGSYRSLLQGHLRETKQHADRIAKRLDQLGYKKSVFAMGYELVQNAAKQSVVLAKTPVDLLRGQGSIKEKMVRNAMDEVMTEGLEIAAYDTIEAVARGIGDHESAELAAAIRLDEERMFESLRKEIPGLADAFVRSDIPADERPVDQPWGGYDDMTVDEIQARLRDESDSMKLAVRNYERKNKNRSTVLEAAE